MKASTSTDTWQLNILCHCQTSACQNRRALVLRADPSAQLPTHQQLLLVSGINMRMQYRPGATAHGEQTDAASNTLLHRAVPPQTAAHEQ